MKNYIPWRTSPMFLRTRPYNSNTVSTIRRPTRSTSSDTVYGYFWNGQTPPLLQKWVSVFVYILHVLNIYGDIDHHCWLPQLRTKMCDRNLFVSVNHLVPFFRSGPVCLWFWCWLPLESCAVKLIPCSEFL